MSEQESGWKTSFMECAGLLEEAQRRENELREKLKSAHDRIKRLEGANKDARRLLKKACLSMKGDD